MNKKMYHRINIEPTIIFKCGEYVRAHPMGQRSHFNGTFEQQRAGLICQVENYRYYKGNYPILYPGNDGGIDFPLNGYVIDTKGMLSKGFY